MGRLGRATCTVHLLSAANQPGRKQMYQKIRKAKSLLSKYIHCDFGPKRKKNLVKVALFFFFLHDDIYPVYHHKDNQLGKNLHTPQWGQNFYEIKITFA